MVYSHRAGGRVEVADVLLLLLILEGRVHQLRGDFVLWGIGILEGCGYGGC